MPDVHMRLVHYKRIASATTASELENLQVELIDRFGLLPSRAKTLFEVTRLKLLAQHLGIDKVHADNTGGFVVFSPRTLVDPLVLVGLVEDEPGLYELDGPSKLRFHWQLDSDDHRLNATETLLRALGASEETPAAA